MLFDVRVRSHQKHKRIHRQTDGYCGYSLTPRTAVGNNCQPDDCQTVRNSNHGVRPIWVCTGL